MRYTIIALMVLLAGCGSRPVVEPVTPPISPSGAPAAASRMTRSLAEAVALNFTSGVKAKGSEATIVLKETVFMGKYWRVDFTVDGRPGALNIITGEGRGVEMIDCPNGQIVAYDIFTSAGGDGTGCWK